MGSLNDIIMKAGVRERVIKDGVVLIDQEVGDRKGITGMAIKGGYAFVKKIKHNFVEDALDGLIDEFIEQLSPFYDEHGSPKGFDSFMAKNQSRVADGLLKVTDRRRDTTSHGSLKKAYDKLRPMAKSNVEQAVPRLGKLVQKYLDDQLG